MYVYSTLKLNMLLNISVHLSVSLNLPVEMQNKGWSYKSEEGDGQIYIYTDQFIKTGKQWQLKSQNGNFLSFRR